MADYDLSKAAPDRSHAKGAGSGAGGFGFIIAGVVIVLVVLYAVFGGAGVPLEQDPAALVTPEATTTDGGQAAPTAETAPAPLD